MKTVLLLGAGVTRAAQPKRTAKTRPPLDSDFFDIAKRVTKRKTEKVEHALESLVGNYSTSLTQSLEAATTYLYIKAIDSTKDDQYHKGFLDHLSLINQVLARTTNSLKTGPRSLIYRFLNSELQKVDEPKDITIITFNYDLLIERVLEEINRRRNNEVFCFPGCYRLEKLKQTSRISNYPEFDNKDYGHSGLSILKLHGSMNWQSIHRSKSPMPHAMFKQDRNLYVMNSRRIPTSLRWRRARTDYLKPVIVPPVSGKRSVIHNEILKLWATAGTALLEADRVVIAGYSCPPLDLEARILISENMRANPSKLVYLIDPNPSIASQFVDLCGVDHITVYTSISDWIRDA